MNPYLARFLYSVLGLSLAAVVLRSVVAPPPDRDHRKLDEIRPSCQVLFVGPSYVKSQIHTELVEAEAARLGHPLRTCKFAKTHLKGFEQYLELRRLLTQSWPKLELVLVDMTLGGDAGYSPDNRLKPRVIRFHLPEIFAWYFQFWAEQHPAQGHAHQLVDHALHVLARALHVGVGAEHLVELSPEGGAAAPPDVEKPSPMSARENKRLLSRMAKERKSLDKKQPKLSSTKRALLLREYALFQEHGVQADVLLAPTWRPNSPGYNKLGKTGPKVHDFAQPQKYPSLYAANRHKADGHLTQEGAEEYSRLLARLIVKRLETQP